MMDTKFEKIKHFSSLLEDTLAKDRKRGLQTRGKVKTIKSRTEIKIKKTKKLNCFRYNFRIHEYDMIEILSNFHASLETYCIRKFSFQDELIILKGAARVYEAQNNLSKDEIRFLNFIYTYTDFFLFSHYSLSKYLDKIGSLRILEGLDHHFEFIKQYNFAASSPMVKNMHKVCVIASYSEMLNMDKIMVSNIQEVIKYNYKNVCFSFIKSNNYTSFKDIFNDVPNYSHLFIIGHGDKDQSEFEFYLRQKKVVPIKAPDFINIFRHSWFESIALLSCAHDSFKSLQGKLPTNHLILPNKSGFPCSEAIIKSFCFELNKSGNFERAYEMSKYSTYFTSLDGVTIKRY